MDSSGENTKLSAQPIDGIDGERHLSDLHDVSLSEEDETARAIRDALAAAIDGASPEVRQFQAELCDSGALRQLYQLAAARRPLAFEALRLMAYRNRIVVQQLANMGAIDLLEQVLVREARSGGASGRLQAAALQLLTSLLAFNLEIHSLVMRTRLVKRLVQLCRPGTSEAQPLSDQHGQGAPQLDSNPGEQQQLQQQSQQQQQDGLDPAAGAEAGAAAGADAVAASAPAGETTPYGAAPEGDDSGSGRQANRTPPQGGRRSSAAEPAGSEGAAATAVAVPGYHSPLALDGSGAGVGPLPRFVGNGASPVCTPVAAAAAAGVGAIATPAAMAMAAAEAVGAAHPDAPVILSEEQQSMAACAAVALRNLCHQIANHPGLLAAGAALELAAVMQREPHPYRRINATMAVALLVGHEEQHPLMRMDAAGMREMLMVLACSRARVMCHGYFWTCWKVCQALARLSANEDNKHVLTLEGGVEVLADVLLSEEHRRKAITVKYCVEALWNLAFYEPARQQILANAALLDAIRAARHSSLDLVREVARGCLFTLGVTDGGVLVRRGAGLPAQQQELGEEGAEAEEEGGSEERELQRVQAIDRPASPAHDRLAPAPPVSATVHAHGSTAAGGGGGGGGYPLPATSALSLLQARRVETSPLHLGGAFGSPAAAVEWPPSPSRPSSPRAALHQHHHHQPPTAEGGAAANAAVSLQRSSSCISSSRHRGSTGSSQHPYPHTQTHSQQQQHQGQPQTHNHRTHSGEPDSPLIQSRGHSHSFAASRAQEQGQQQPGLQHGNGPGFGPSSAGGHGSHSYSHSQCSHGPQHPINGQLAHQRNRSAAMELGGYGDGPMAANAGGAGGGGEVGSGGTHWQGGGGSGAAAAAAAGGDLGAGSTGGGGGLLCGGHVMISYEWGSQQKALMIKEALERRGLKTWMDVEKMSGSTLEAMALAVEGATAVLLCITKRYKESQACRAEAEYAFQQRKRIIPIMMERGYRPTGWLGILVGTKLYFDCSERRLINERVAALERELGPLARLCRRPASASAAVPAMPAAGGGGGCGAAASPRSASARPASATPHAGAASPAPSQGASQHLHHQVSSSLLHHHQHQHHSYNHQNSGLSLNSHHHHHPNHANHYGPGNVSGHNSRAQSGSVNRGGHAGCGGGGATVAAASRPASSVSYSAGHRSELPSPSPSCYQQQQHHAGKARRGSAATYILLPDVPDDIGGAPPTDAVSLASAAAVAVASGAPSSQLVSLLLESPSPEPVGPPGPDPETDVEAAAAAACPLLLRESGHQGFACPMGPLALPPLPPLPPPGPPPPGPPPGPPAISDPRAAGSASPEGATAAEGCATSLRLALKPPSRCCGPASAAAGTGSQQQQRRRSDAAVPAGDGGCVGGSGAGKAAPAGRASLDLGKGTSVQRKAAALSDDAPSGGGAAGWASSPLPSALPPAQILQPHVTRVNALGHNHHYQSNNRNHNHNHQLHCQHGAVSGGGAPHSHSRVHSQMHPHPHVPGRNHGLSHMHPDWRLHNAGFGGGNYATPGSAATADQQQPPPPPPPWQQQQPADGAGQRQVSAAPPPPAGPEANKGSDGGELAAGTDPDPDPLMLHLPPPLEVQRLREGAARAAAAAALVGVDGQASPSGESGAPQGHDPMRSTPFALPDRQQQQQRQGGREHLANGGPAAEAERRPLSGSEAAPSQDQCSSMSPAARFSRQQQQQQQQYAEREQRGFEGGTAEAAEAADERAGASCPPGSSPEAPVSAEDANNNNNNNNNNTDLLVPSPTAGVVVVPDPLVAAGVRWSEYNTVVAVAPLQPLAHSSLSRYRLVHVNTSTSLGLTSDYATSVFGGTAGAPSEEDSELVAAVDGSPGPSSPSPPPPLPVSLRPPPPLAPSIHGTGGEVGAAQPISVRVSTIAAQGLHSGGGGAPPGRGADVDVALARALSVASDVACGSDGADAAAAQAADIEPEPAPLPQAEEEDEPAVAGKGRQLSASRCSLQRHDDGGTGNGKLLHSVSGGPLESIDGEGVSTDADGQSSATPQPGGSTGDLLGLPGGSNAAEQFVQALHPDSTAAAAAAAGFAAAFEAIAQAQQQQQAQGQERQALGLVPARSRSRFFEGGASGGGGAAATIATAADAIPAAAAAARNPNAESREQESALPLQVQTQTLTAAAAPAVAAVQPPAQVQAASQTRSPFLTLLRPVTAALVSAAVALAPPSAASRVGRLSVLERTDTVTAVPVPFAREQGSSAQLEDGLLDARGTHSLCGAAAAAAANNVAPGAFGSPLMSVLPSHGPVMAAAPPPQQPLKDAPQDVDGGGSGGAAAAATSGLTALRWKAMAWASRRADAAAAVSGRGTAASAGGSASGTAEAPLSPAASVLPAAPSGVDGDADDLVGERLAMVMDSSLRRSRTSRERSRMSIDEAAATAAATAADRRFHVAPRGQGHGQQNGPMNSLSRQNSKGRRAGGAGVPGAGCDAGWSGRQDGDEASASDMRLEEAVFSGRRDRASGGGGDVGDGGPHLGRLGSRRSLGPSAAAAGDAVVLSMTSVSRFSVGAASVAEAAPLGAGGWSRRTFGTEWDQAHCDDDADGQCRGFSGGGEVSAIWQAEVSALASARASGAAQSRVSAVVLAAAGADARGGPGTDGEDVQTARSDSDDPFASQSSSVAVAGLGPGDGGGMGGLDTEEMGAGMQLEVEEEEEEEEVPPSSTCELVERWKAPQVRDWLVRIGQGGRADRFEEVGITGRALCGLMRVMRGGGGAAVVRDILRHELGVTGLAAQLELLEELHRLFD